MPLFFGTNRRNYVVDARNNPRLFAVALNVLQNTHGLFREQTKNYTLPRALIGLTTTVLLLGVLAVATHAQNLQNPPSSDGPDGPPPGADPGSPPPDDGGVNGPPRPPPNNHRAYKLSGAYTLSSGAAKTEIAKKYGSSAQDISAIWVSENATLTLISPTIETSGETSSNENSSFYGLNAAVLITKGGIIKTSGGSIVTSGRGANGAFATDAGSSAILSGLKIVATGDGGHGVMVSAGGSMTLTEVDMVTSGAHGAAVATDRGGGKITVVGGDMTTSGPGSPGIYSTGTITATGSKFTATSSEAAVIEGQNSIVLKNTSLSGEKLCGVMIYQSFSGDAEGHQGVFTMEGGSFSAHEGPAFYVTNSTGVISLTKVNISASSGILVKASTGRWGRQGTNGGNAILTANTQTLTGDLICDSASTISATLQKNSTLTGTIKGAALTLDATSSWNVTDDSTLTSLADPSAMSGQTIANIHGNGHTVRYETKNPANQWLNGKTYKLADGGQLVPAP